MSPYTQAKLLRVLQEHEFRPSGQQQDDSTAARIVFATHRNLDEMVAEGRFRQDLYYRINVMRIETPALQEHSEDIPQIAAYFLRRYANLYRRPVIDIDPSAMDALRNYPWPGNLRELQNPVQRAVIVAEADSLTVEDPSADLFEDEKVSLYDAEKFPGGPFERQLRDYKIKLATTGVREHRGSKTQAARSLRILRAYLHRLIRHSDTELSNAPERKAVGQ